MAVVHAYAPPERFIVGTVGEPGNRTFFLQARSGQRITSVSLEKQQVAVLGERIEELLDDLMKENSNGAIPAITPHRLHDSAPLEQPIVEEFRVGTMTLSWDANDAVVVVEVFPLELNDGSDEDDSSAFEEYRDAVENADDDEIPAELADELAEALADVLGADDYEEMLLVRMPAAQARAFASRAALVVKSGRPTCPFCSEPMDPAGHLCVRANGFRRRLS